MHYYKGSERVSAKTGTVERLCIFPGSLLTTHMPGLDQSFAGPVKSTSIASVTDANTMVSGVYTKFELTKTLGVKTVDGREPASFAHVQGLLNIFYFHPDHLSSSSYITNQDGNTCRFGNSNHIINKDRKTI